MSQDWTNPSAASSVAGALAALKARSETQRSNWQGADPPSAPTKGQTYCDDDNVFWKYTGSLWVPLIPEPEPEIEIDYTYVKVDYHMFGPVQPSETGGSFKFFPPTEDDWHHGGQMFSAWNILLEFGPNGNGYAIPEIARAKWNIIWQPSSSAITARICHHAASSEDPDYDAEDFNIQTIATQAGEDEVGPVPRGAYVTTELEALRVNGWPKQILTQFYITEPGEYCYLTKSSLEITYKIPIPTLA